MKTSTTRGLALAIAVAMCSWASAVSIEVIPAFGPNFPDSPASFSSWTSQCYL